ncbi:MAG: nickel transporter [Pseudomonadota bacterium]
MRLAFILLICLAAGPAFAQFGPFGTGVPAEPQVGFGFDRLIAWTAAAQSEFYQGLTTALRQVEASSTALLALLGLAFLYGVVHAAGPGHGKVIIGSYMLASGDTARRGALLAIAAATLQATGAVMMVGLVVAVFGLGQTVIANATITLERLSYTLIIAVGIYLLWRLAKGWVAQPARLSMASAASAGAPPMHSHDLHAHHVHGPDCGCDHAHMPDAETVEAATGPGQLAAIVFSAGLRPCTGAILVLVLAISQGLFWQGAAAAYAMAVGTALTVGLLAVMAGSFSSAINVLSAADSPVVRLGQTIVQLLGGVMIIGFGVLLLSASLAR